MGVILIALLNILGALVLLFLGFGLIMAAFWVSGDPEMGDILGPLLGLIGLLLFLLGIAFMILSVALLRLKPWARTVMRVLAGIGTVFGILMLLGGDWSSIISLIINIVTFIYLGMAHVKEAFMPMPTVYQQPRTY